MTRCAEGEAFYPVAKNKRKDFRLREPRYGVGEGGGDEHSDRRQIDPHSDVIYDGEAPIAS